MFDVGGFELVVIVLAIILLFGPKSIPKFMQQIGRGVRQFRKAQEELTQQIRDISADAAIQDALNIDNPQPPIAVRPADGVSRSSIQQVTSDEDLPESESSSIEPSALPDASADTPPTDRSTPTAS